VQSKDSNDYKALQKAAQSLRGKLAVAFSETNIGGFKAPAIQVLPAIGQNEFHGAEMLDQSLGLWKSVRGSVCCRFEQRHGASARNASGEPPSP
jgi:hypothetical protein